MDCNLLLSQTMNWGALIAVLACLAFWGLIAWLIVWAAG